MKKLLFMFLWLPAIAFGQETPRIKFEQGNWEQIKAKARQENKYIFVDCFATWCGLCKRMDSEVYPLSEVAGFMNDHFISVKLQMDSTAKDNEEIRLRYPDRRCFFKNYKISGFPTFLFFDPNGDIIEQGAGFIVPADFIALSKKALAPERLRFYQLLEQYQNDKKDFTVMAYLALTADSLGKADLAKQIALNYKHNYLDHQDEQELASKENLEFIEQFSYLLNGSKDKFFSLFYHHPDIIIGHMNNYPVYSRTYVNQVVQKEEIDDKLYNQGKPVTDHPDWGYIDKNITIKYGKVYADDLIISARINFYKQAGKWKQFAEEVNLVMKTHPPKINGNDFANATMIGDVFQRDDWNLNSGAWAIFQHSNDKQALKIALQWSELSIQIAKNDPGFCVQYYDTKANLLYKTGKVKEAIALEKLDVAKSKGAHDYIDNLNKMKQGKPTW